MGSGRIKTMLKFEADGNRGVNIGIDSSFVGRRRT